MRLEQNIGPTDRTVRVVLGAALIAGGTMGLPGLWRVPPGVAGAVLVFSGTVGFCHVRQFLGSHRLARR